MAKYKLLRDLPLANAGTVLEANENNCIHGYSAAGFPEWFELVKEEWPQEGDEYWAIGNEGTIYLTKSIGAMCDTFRAIVGNCFRTRQEAEYHKLRQESGAKRWRPEASQDSWYWELDFKRPINVAPNTWQYSHYFMGNVHETRLCAVDWAKKFAPAFNSLLK